MSDNHPKLNSYSNKMISEVSSEGFQKNCGEKLDFDN